MAPWKFYVLFAVVLCTSTAYVMLIEGSKSEQSVRPVPGVNAVDTAPAPTFGYSYVALLAMTSTVKLVVTVAQLCVSRAIPGEQPKFTSRGFGRFTCSAILYTVNDVLVFVVMAQGFSARAYTILVTGKIVVVSILSRVVLHKQYTAARWASVVLLSLGIVVSAFPFCADDERPPLSAYGVVLVSEVVGGSAGILNEYLMKREDGDDGAEQPLHFQNCNLYLACVLIQYPLVLVFDAGKEVWFDRDAGITEGFGTAIWAAVAVNATRGLAISMVYKFSTNITKIFIVAMSILLTGLLSSVIFDEPIDAQWVLGFAIILLALFYYNRCVLPLAACCCRPRTLPAANALSPPSFRSFRFPSSRRCVIADAAAPATAPPPPPQRRQPRRPHQGACLRWL